MNSVITLASLEDQSPRTLLLGELRSMNDELGGYLHVYADAHLACITAVSYSPVGAAWLPLEAFDERSLTSNDAYIGLSDENRIVIAYVDPQFFMRLISAGSTLNFSAHCPPHGREPYAGWCHEDFNPRDLVAARARFRRRCLSGSH